MNNRQQRLNFFLVVWFTMISCLTGWGQNPCPELLKKDFSLLQYPGDSRGPNGRNTALLPKNKEAVSYSYSSRQTRVLSYFNRNLNVVEITARNEDLYEQPSNLYYLQSGFFCKREWEFEKATHIPFRFRLGSLADCNAMEGKR